MKKRLSVLTICLLMMCSGQTFAQISTGYAMCEFGGHASEGLKQVPFGFYYPTNGPALDIPARLKMMAMPKNKQICWSYALKACNFIAYFEAQGSDWLSALDAVGTNFSVDPEDLLDIASSMFAVVQSHNLSCDQPLDNNNPNPSNYPKGAPFEHPNPDNPNFETPFNWLFDSVPEPAPHQIQDSPQPNLYIPVPNFTLPVSIDLNILIEKVEKAKKFLQKVFNERTMPLWVTLAIASILLSVGVGSGISGFSLTGPFAALGIWAILIVLNQGKVITDDELDQFKYLEQLSSSINNEYQLLEIDGDNERFYLELRSGETQWALITIPKSEKDILSQRKIDIKFSTSPQLKQENDNTDIVKIK